MHSLLVIGGSGFVGAALVPMLLSRGYTVTLLNRGSRPIPGTAQLTADRNDLKAMQRVAQKFEAVIDTSAYTKRQAEIAFSVFGHHAKKWIHLSSAAVYKETRDHLPSEKDCIGGAAVWGEYGREKSAADHFLLNQDITQAVAIRPPYLYGPNNDIDREQFVWARALTKRPIILPADGQTKLQFLHEDDLASFILHLLALHSMPTGAINLADPHILTIEKWVKTLCDIAELTPEILLGYEIAPNIPAREYFPYTDYDCALDVTNYQENFDWQPHYKLREGFTHTFNSYSREELARSSPSTTAEKTIEY
ncbi:NAD-dependent epimerase/dehydratase family protein [Pseudovibrio sp. Tun.PSC04-5.I4]|uniref:NAD-dependent epimerase/dehydratase family protein n=1 Tax=Pseudovibrio sp. Tun.PSC04-5.I4 TaxID=1798213 RepID=UPI0008866587|nr:NAD-dependent epimerase/dehydratase family protein [Pseudovibrio sp. Tun.PSC04-5.I4]SDR30903.1 Nucleoside-diphosphate-sugar epimerase [Pseudovibrio sp. Tun.PSC04-5.I4]